MQIEITIKFTATLKKLKAKKKIKERIRMTITLKKHKKGAK